MNSSFKLISAASLALLASCSNEKKDIQDSPGPNIILIMADDMGYSDLGCFGSEIHTPNLDSLADSGLRLTQFYNASRCCPTRASLLTGLYQHQAGIGDMVGDYGIPAYQGYLNNQCMTMAEVLKTAGYDTYMSGKWHVGTSPEHWPRKRGFDRYFGLITGASNYYNLNPYRVNGPPSIMALDDSRYYPPDTGYYMTDAFGDYACRFLEEHKESRNPFFLYLPFTSPHWPLHAYKEDIDKYLGTYMIGWDSLRAQRYISMKEMGIIKGNWDLSPRNDVVPSWDSVSAEDKKMWDRRMAVYAAMIDRMDQNIGRVFTTLRKENLDHNTLIVFIADNGGCHERVKNVGNYIHTTGITGDPDSFDSYQYNWANASNTPFRMFKHWVNEGGISSPFIAWYPGFIDKGVLNTKNPAHIIDLMPTFIELSGAEYPREYKGNPVKPLPGESIVPLLQGKPMNDRTLFWEHEGNQALRQGNWKIISTFDRKERTSGPWELYNLDNDRSELNNLSEKYPDVIKLMVSEYDSLMTDFDVLPFEEVLRIRDQGATK